MIRPWLKAHTASDLQPADATYAPFARSVAREKPVWITGPSSRRPYRPHQGHALTGQLTLGPGPRRHRRRAGLLYPRRTFIGRFYADGKRPVPQRHMAGESGRPRWTPLACLGGATFFYHRARLAAGVAAVSDRSAGRCSKQKWFYQAMSLVGEHSAARCAFVILFESSMIPFTVVIAGTSLGRRRRPFHPLGIGATRSSQGWWKTAMRCSGPRALSRATQAAGATPRQIVTGPAARSMPGIIARRAVTRDYACVLYRHVRLEIGGGGLGDLAVRYGYQRYSRMSWSLPLCCC